MSNIVGNLAHYTNKKKPIILENGECPVWLTVNEILDKYDNYAHSIAYKNRIYILSGYNPKYAEDDLYVLAMEALFIAYNKYDVKYKIPFLAYAKPQILFKMKNVRDDINSNKREIDKNITYIDPFNDDGEFLDIYTTFDTSKLDVCEYIDQIIGNDKFEKEMRAICDSIIECGEVDFDEIQFRTGKSKVDISNIKKKLKKIIVRSNKKYHYFKCSI